MHIHTDHLPALPGTKWIYFYGIPTTSRKNRRFTTTKINTGPRDQRENTSSTAIISIPFRPLHYGLRYLLLAATHRCIKPKLPQIRRQAYLPGHPIPYAGECLQRTGIARRTLRWKGSGLRSYWAAARLAGKVMRVTSSFLDEIDGHQYVIYISGETGSLIEAEQIAHAGNVILKAREPVSK